MRKEEGMEEQSAQPSEERQEETNNTVNKHGWMNMWMCVLQTEHK
jgi:hypothetical protein